MYKKILTSLLAVTLTFGGLGMNTVRWGELLDSEITASAETVTGSGTSTSTGTSDSDFVPQPVDPNWTYDPETFTYGDYSYIILDDGTVEIYSYNGNNTTLTIPFEMDGKKVTSIGSYAFLNCESITSVTIPNGVTTISDYAFVGCSYLTNVTIPNSVTAIGDRAFFNSGLTNINIPSSVTSIGFGAFELCFNLKSVTIPNGITSIKKYTFSDCYNLESVTIPNSVVSIEYGAFDACQNLESITIPNSVTSIGDNAFRRCTSLKTLTLPNSVKEIGKSICADCQSLTSISINNNYYTTVNGVLFDKAKTVLKAYPAGNKRTSYAIPSSVKTIEAYAFEFCQNLKSITIPNSVTDIDYGAFYDCYNLTSIELPESIVTIGGYAFFGCEKVKSVKIPMRAASIGKYAFGYYTGTNSTGFCAITKVPGFKISCYSGTAGETYAKDNGFEYEVLTPSVSVPEVISTGFTAESNFVTLTWNKASGVTGYRIYRYNTSTKKWDTIKTITNNKKPVYTDWGVKSGTVYKYKIKAYIKKNGVTTWGVSTPTIKTATAPAMAAISSITDKTKTSVKLNWKKVSGADGYQIQIYKNGKWKTLTSVSNVTSYKVTGLKKDTAYKFKVRAYKKVDSKTLFGEYSTAKKATTKK